jgi:hypothetical protein
MMSTRWVTDRRPRSATELTVFAAPWLLPALPNGHRDRCGRGLGIVGRFDRGTRVGWVPSCCAWSTARRIKDDFRPETWLAFWQTAVDKRPVAGVARLLGKNPGAVYAARGRVMRRLKKNILEWEPPG